MESRDGLPAAERRRFQTGRPCLDFTHTGGGGPFAQWELLHAPADAARYLGIVLGCEPPRTTGADMEPIRHLRRAMATVARRLADDPTNTIPPSAVAVLNDAAANAPLRVELTGDGRQTLLSGSARAACSSLARDAIDLFASPFRNRIRICAADDCGLLFVDTSRPGQRRWCSMNWCGDREKKRRSGRPVG